MTNALYKIGLTHGDYNGIGYEVLLKTLSDERMTELCTPIIYGTKRLAEYYLNLLGLKLPRPLSVIKSPEEAAPGTLSLIDITPEGREAADITPGAPSANSALYAVRALERARADLDGGRIDAVVTAPIHKDTASGIPLSEEAGGGMFPGGHTEFFAATHPDEKALMVFTDGRGLQVGLLTIHLPLSQVPGSVTREGVINFVRRFERTLRADFGFEKPRMALLGLNPHAGENGLLGEEEKQRLIPAVSDLWETGTLILGPYPADGFWGSSGWQKFDGIVALYHDQGLIPFKLLAMNSGVNVTAGLSVVRTSPDHGTAFDIAGKGIADPGSFRSALYCALDILRRRAVYSENTADPLPINRSHRKWEEK